MGKIFPLSEKPSCYEDTIKMIERSFHYQEENHFEIDFAPLVDKTNHHNCYILLDDSDNILAHIGAKEKTLTLNDEKFKVVLLGGIAVDENSRGQGYFQAIMNEIISEKRSDTTFFILWSDQTKLYQKFGFYLCGDQFEVEYQKKDQGFKKTKLNQLSQNEKNQVKNLYEESFLKNYFSFERTDQDWRMLEKITSADLYIRRDRSEITDYFFMNKGQDLNDIIYEYGSKNNINEFIHTLRGYGKVWSGKPTQDTGHTQYQFLMSPGDQRHFGRFITYFTDSKISVRKINIIKQEVFFDYNQELYSLEIEDFLRGIFGPGKFEELDVPSFFISGLDSI